MNRAKFNNYSRANLKAEYLFTSGSMNDTSGNGLTATNTGATSTTDRFGNPNDAMAVGINDRISTPSWFNSDTKATFSTWFKITAWNITEGNYLMIRIGGLNDQFYIDKTSRKLSIIIANTSNTISFLSDMAFELNTLYCMTILYDNSLAENDRLKVYINAKEITKTIAGIGSRNPVLESSTEYFGFSASSNASTNGILDDSRIFTNRISLYEIKTLQYKKMA